MNKVKSGQNSKQVIKKQARQGKSPVPAKIQTIENFTNYNFKNVVNLMEVLQNSLLNQSDLQKIQAGFQQQKTLFQQEARNKKSNFTRTEIFGKDLRQIINLERCQSVISRFESQNSGIAPVDFEFLKTNFYPTDINLLKNYVNQTIEQNISSCIFVVHGGLYGESMGHKVRFKTFSREVHTFVIF